MRDFLTPLPSYAGGILKHNNHRSFCLLFCPLNLSFGGIIVAAVVVVCLSSLTAFSNCLQGDLQDVKFILGNTLRDCPTTAKVRQWRIWMLTTAYWPIHFFHYVSYSLLDMPKLFLLILKFSAHVFVLRVQMILNLKQEKIKVLK